MSTLWMTLKRAVDAEMPKASVITATAVNPRLLARVRMAYRKSWIIGARARSRRMLSVIPPVGRTRGRQGSGKYQDFAASPAPTCGRDVTVGAMDRKPRVAP